jgi:branched-subunit amino acid transport protein AzlD
VAISQNIIQLLNLYCMGDIVTGQLNIETINIFAIFLVAEAHFLKQTFES